VNAASGSTATGTTATDKSAGAPRPPVAGAGAGAYVGRFAPSPTGSLHLGSLVAALGSYLDARHHGGRWQLRMEDLDTPRVVRGCADQILRTLESFGLTWDGEVTYQSRHTQRYAAAVAELRAGRLTFECSCSRRLRAENEDRGYPGTCRDKPPMPPPTATRFRVDERESICFEDRFQGACEFELRSMGDVVIRRRDGIYAYQLAVVVDDAAEGITHVVRGADLLASTVWQICLQRALHVPTPSYAHLPLIVEPDGAKLAKSRRSVPLDVERRGLLLLAALRLLRQSPPSSLEFEAPPAILQWGIAHWNPDAFRGTRTLPAS
jgi:glutamyl-Q tRNA(Asp) synthetase